MKLDHLQFPEKGWGYLPPTEEVFTIFKFCQKKCKPTSVLEIGFHIGHSTTYMLEIFSDLESMMSISPVKEVTGKPDDRVPDEVRSDMAKYLSENYRGKFQWIPGTTSELSEKLYNYFFDFALVDGNHHEIKATIDVKLCEDIAIPYILVDNWERFDVRKATEKSSYKMVKRFFYEQTFKGKTSKNQMALFML
jgi:hypothetical protein